MVGTPPHSPPTQANASPSGSGSSPSGNGHASRKTIRTVAFEGPSDPAGEDAEQLPVPPVPADLAPEAKPEVSLRHGAPPNELTSLPIHLSNQQGMRKELSDINEGSEDGGSSSQGTLQFRLPDDSARGMLDDTLTAPGADANPHPAQRNPLTMGVFRPASSHSARQKATGPGPVAESQLAVRPALPAVGLDSGLTNDSSSRLDLLEDEYASTIDSAGGFQFGRAMSGQGLNTTPRRDSEQAGYGPPYTPP